MNIFISIVLLSSFYSVAAISQVTSSTDISAQSRYLQVSSTKKAVQENITIRASIDYNGHFEIHSLLQTGDTYSLGFNPVYNIKNNEMATASDAMQLHLKQIYLKKYLNHKKSEMALGVINPESQIDSSLNLSPIGWIDGLRFKQKNDFGEINYTIGQIQPLEPNVTNRFDNFKMNFIEISLKKSVFEKLLVQARLQSFNSNQFASVSINTDLFHVLLKIIKTTADLQYDLNNQSFRYSIGVRDLINSFSQRKSNLNVSLDYEYISKDFSKDVQLLSSSMNSSFKGHAFVLKTTLLLSKKEGLNFFTNIRIGSDINQLRIESGLSKSIFKPRK